MLNRNITIPITFLFVLLAGCALPQTGPQLTPLEVQSLQTREYEATKDIVFPSVISVFQDLGYTIKSAHKDTGLITAESATKDTSSIWDSLVSIHVNQQTAATAFIETIGTATRVRVNFVAKKTSSSAYGQNKANDTPILDAQIYQNAFERIENAIFIRSSS